MKFLQGEENKAALTQKTAYVPTGYTPRNLLVNDGEKTKAKFMFFKNELTEQQIKAVKELTDVRFLDKNEQNSLTYESKYSTLEEAMKWTE